MVRKIEMKGMAGPYSVVLTIEAKKSFCAGCDNLDSGSRCSHFPFPLLDQDEAVRDGSCELAQINGARGTMKASGFVPY